MDTYETVNIKYKAYNSNNFRTIAQVQSFLSEQQKYEIEVVACVFPFKVNNYIIDELIDWNNIPHDPIFRLVFPQRDMLSPDDFNTIAEALKKQISKDEFKAIVNEIRYTLNPHPGDQKSCNVPQLNDKGVEGVQHKYAETILFFPSQAQTCHAYCNFCFRWPQFVGIDELKFASKETDTLISYIHQHPEITDLLLTGGDPMVMTTNLLEQYLVPLLSLNAIKTIRIGTKALSFWPYRFIEGEDSNKLLSLFKKIVDSGKLLSIMAHFSHPVEHKTEAVKKAIKAIQSTGAQIRTQSPVIRYVNDDSSVWKEMWELQTNLGCIPYYMFIARDTGAQSYFGVPLLEACDIFRNAYKKVSGLARTVKGPIMSTSAGKIQVLGTLPIFKDKAILLQFIQSRNPDWTNKPFLGAYNESALWIDDLKPYNENKFFYEPDSHTIITT